MPATKDRVARLYLTEYLREYGIMDPVVEPTTHGTFVITTQTASIEVAQPSEDSDRLRWAMFTAKDVLARLAD